MASMIPMAASLGQQDAQNPNIGAAFSEPHGGVLSYAGGKGGSGSLGSDLGKLDPLGNGITQLGGDPLDLYGNKNNPNALFFPSGSGAHGSVPSVLPTLAGIGAPQRYSPASFGGYANLGAGPFNAMAAQMAGPVYQPQIQGPGQAAAVRGVAPLPPRPLGVRGPASLVPFISPLWKTQVQ